MTKLLQVYPVTMDGSEFVGQSGTGISVAVSGQQMQKLGTVTGSYRMN